MLIWIEMGINSKALMAIQLKISYELKENVAPCVFFFKIESTVLCVKM